MFSVLQRIVYLWLTAAPAYAYKNLNRAAFLEAPHRLGRSSACNVHPLKRCIFTTARERSSFLGYDALENTVFPVQIQKRRLRCGDFRY